MITGVSAAGFKGQTFEEQLAPVTFIRGENSSGKSAILEALMLAVNGYLPGASGPIKSPKILHDLYASADVMSVGFTSDVPLLCAVRKYSKSSSGSVSYAGPKDAAAPPHCLDASVYLGLSGPARLRFLFSELAGAAPDKTKLVEAVCANLKQIRVEGDGKLAEAAITSMVALARSQKGETGQDVLEGLVEQFKQAKLSADDTVRRQQNVSRGMAESADKTAPPPLDAEARLHRAQAALTEAVTAEALLSDRLARCREEWAAANSAALLIAGAATAQAAYDARLASMPPQPGRRVPANDAAWSVARGAHAEAATRLAVAKAAAAVAARNLKDAAAKDAPCPHCGQELPAATKKKALTKARAEARDAELELEQATAWLSRCQAELDPLQRQIDEFSAAGAAYAQAVGELASLKARIPTDEQKALAATLPAIVAKGEALKASKAEAATASASARTEVATAARDWQRLAAVRAEEAAKERAAEEAESARVRAAVAGQASKMAAELLSKLVDGAVAPLVSSMNSLCADALGAEGAYQDGELRFAGWTHKSASDSEQLAIHAALSMALAARSPIKLAVVGRLESMDGRRAQAIVDAARGLIAAGTIHQCLFVEVFQGKRPVVLGDGCRVITRERSAL